MIKWSDDKTGGSMQIGGTCRAISFLTVLMILTLDASNGKDLLDVVIPYIESLTVLNNTWSN